MELDIADELKQFLSKAPINGSKLATIKIELYSESDLPDVYQLINYKKSAK